MPFTDWESNENAWSGRHGTALREYLALAGQAQQILHQIAFSTDFRVQPASKSLWLEHMFIARMAEEYRVIELAAARGHGMQALGMCATVFEIASLLTLLAGDDAAAEPWFTHTNHTALPVRDNKLIVKDALKRIGAERSVAEERYKSYRFYCAFKHHNPVIARLYSREDVDLVDLHLCKLALADGAIMIVQSVGWTAFMRSENASELIPQVDALNRIGDTAGRLMPSLKDIGIDPVAVGAVDADSTST